MNQVWTKSEEQFVRENSATMTDKVGAEQLSTMSGRQVSIYAWRKKRQSLGLVKAPGRGVCAMAAQPSGPTKI